MANDLVSVIKAKQAAIARLQGELDEARAILAGNPVPPKRAEPVARLGKSRRTKKSDEGVLEPGSASYLAAQAIRTAGRPLHANDLVKAIEQHTGKKIKLPTLVGGLSRWVTKKSVFYRAGRNIFGLIEMKK
jgi:hypothetical protein